MHLVIIHGRVKKSSQLINSCATTVTDTRCVICQLSHPFLQHIFCNGLQTIWSHPRRKFSVVTEATASFASSSLTNLRLQKTSFVVKTWSSDRARSGVCGGCVKVQMSTAWLLQRYLQRNAYAHYRKAKVPPSKANLCVCCEALSLVSFRYFNAYWPEKTDHSLLFYKDVLWNRCSHR